MDIDNELEFYPLAGRIGDLTRGEVLECEPLPSHLIEMIEDGGLIAHLKKKLGNR